MKRKLFTRITAGLCFAVLILGLGYESCCRAAQDTMCKNVLRLHVLANSDSDEDIAVKNNLAMGMKPIIDKVFEDCHSFEQAQSVAKNNSKYLCDTAKDILEEMGCDDGVRITVSPQKYSDRCLDGVVYPAGEYCSVRLIIGEGKGHNWWCVLFSPLTDVGIEHDGTNKDSVKVKFKFLEWFS